MNKATVAVLTGLLLAGFTAAASAQSAKKAAPVSKRQATQTSCISKALSSAPTIGFAVGIDDTATQQARFAAYASCMKGAGLNP